jgi:predicted RNase H-like HicB family nuclease
MLFETGLNSRDGRDYSSVRTFSAYVEWEPEMRLYVGSVPEVPGAHTQAATLDELRTNLEEVLELCLEEAC